MRSLALEEIHSRYPARTWTHTYTDGSATDATRNGGSGAYILQPKSPPVSLSTPSGALSSNYRAEVSALNLAANYLNRQEEAPKKVVFLTDSLSALQALSSDDPEQCLKELKHQLNALSKKAAVVLQWIPAHRGIRGNEMADRLAKEGSKMEQPPVGLSYRETKALIKNRWTKKATCSQGNYKPHQDPLHLLTRSQQTTIFRLRTGHCRLRAHMRRIGVADSAVCECGEGDQTPEHMLQDCPRLNQLRLQTWPLPTDLSTKLWGSREQLERTTQFLALTGHTI